MRKEYKKAKDYFNLQKGWVLHHKDVTLRLSNPERYNQWRIEDLVPMTKSEHRRLHNLLDNPMNYEENRQKISEAMDKWKDIPRGTCSTMSDEDYRAMRSKMTSNRNKTMWKNEDYKNYMVEKMHASQYYPVKWVEGNIKYKCLREAERETGVSRYLIKQSCDFKRTINDEYTFEWMEVA